MSRSSYLVIIIYITYIALNVNRAVGGPLGSIFHGLPGAGNSSNKGGNNKVSEEDSVTSLEEIGKLTANLLHGDVVGAAIDGVTLLETIKNLRWPIKFVLKLTKTTLDIIHPVFLKIFPVARNDGNLIDSLLFSVSHGGSMMSNCDNSGRFYSWLCCANGYKRACTTANKKCGRVTFLSDLAALGEA